MDASPTSLINRVSVTVCQRKKPKAQFYQWLQGSINEVCKWGELEFKAFSSLTFIWVPKAVWGMSSAEGIKLKSLTASSCAARHKCFSTQSTNKILECISRQKENGLTGISGAANPEQWCFKKSAHQNALIFPFLSDDEPTKRMKWC